MTPHWGMNDNIVFSFCFKAILIVVHYELWHECVWLDRDHTENIWVEVRDHLPERDRIILLLNRNFEIWFDLTWYLEILFMVRYFYGFLYLCFRILETLSFCSLFLEGKIIIVINERESEMSVVIGVGVGRLTWQDEGWPTSVVATY